MWIRSMLDAFRGHISPARPERRPLILSEASIKVEADLSENRTKAMAANNHVSMGVVLDATRAMAAESRVRAFLGGMIDAADRGKGHDGRA